MDNFRPPVEVPPFQVQRLIQDVVNYPNATGRAAQAFGSEIYVGCTNGDLLRFALQANAPNKVQSYTLLSTQKLPGDKPIDEIVLIPSLSTALVFKDHQIHFYSIPSLDPLPIKPIRNVITFAVDDHHLKRPPPSAAPAGVNLPIDPVDFCAIKRTGVGLYTLRDRLAYIKDFPLPQANAAVVARRAGKILCIADKTFYHIVDLQNLSTFPLLPICQAQGVSFDVKPSITVISPNEFLILSWTGAGALGLFITGDGDAVRGTLQWSSHPEAICLDYPYIMSLLPNNTIEVHSLETQAVVQTIGSASPSVSETIVSSPGRSSAHRRQSSTASTRSLGGMDSSRRLNLISTSGGYVVPSTQTSDKLRKVPVSLLRS